MNNSVVQKGFRVYRCHVDIGYSIKACGPLLTAQCSYLHSTAFELFHIIRHELCNKDEEAINAHLIC